MFYDRGMSEDKKAQALAVWKRLGSSKWEHPDPILSGMILMMSANGMKLTKIAEITGLSRQLLNRFYKRELINGAAAVEQEIFNKLVERILHEEDPKQSLKAMEIYYKYNRKKDKEEVREEIDPKSTGDSVKGIIDPKKLTVEELRILTSLMEKGMMDTPKTVIDVKATRKD